MNFLKWPVASQWKQFFKVLDKKEKYFFFSALALFSFSVIFLVINLYFENTEIVPKRGGHYTEGVIGQPRLINPIFAPANDTDRDLSELIFSGLLKYDHQGKLTPDLAESYQISEEGKIFEFNLKEDLFWQDGKPLTANDVIFTVKTIQNPDYKSPLRPSWLGVEAEKISETKIRFTLKNPSAIFLENATLKILPKHIWQDINPNNFPLSAFNLKPVGSGPYKIKKISQDKDGKITSLILVKNPYSLKEPNLNKITFKFFETESNLMKAAQNKDIEGFSLADSANAAKFTDYANYSFSLPRYFAVFLNPEKQKIFADQKIIQALNYGTDKNIIIEQILSGKGKVVDSPVLPDIYGFNPPQKIYQFDISAAKDLLEKAGFQETANGIREKIVKKEIPFQFKSNLKSGSQGTEVTELQKCLAKDEEIYPDGEVTGSFGPKTKEAVIKFQEKYRQDILAPSGLEQGTGEILGATRKKLNEICFPATEQKTRFSFTLILPTNQNQLIEVAKLLKNQWQAIGAEVEIKTVDIGTLEREIIKSRNYDAILFGEILGVIPDPFPFWYSSQKKDPGLNLAMYENAKADKLLEEARQTSDEKIRREKLESFQELFLSEIPIVLLYNPDYLYFSSKEIKGINAGVIVDPSKRFAEISNWYIETKRAWK